MLNLITGICGKTTSTYTDTNITKDNNELFNYLQKNIFGKPFLYTKELDNENVYFYGKETRQNLQEHSLPIYIQILDQSNIKLYEMIKKCGDAKCVYRKTDCILMKSNTKINIELGKKWGEYSVENYPKMFFQNKYDKRGEIGSIIYKKLDELKVTNWKKVNILDSNEYQKIYDETIKNRGFM